MPLQNQLIHSTLERDLTGSINHTHTADDITPKNTPENAPKIKIGLAPQNH